MQALCLVGCKSVYTNQASEIAKELINGGCTRLAMVEAGNQLPNAAPFPARPPPPPPVLVPAHGVAFRQSGSPTFSDSDESHPDDCKDSERHGGEHGDGSAANGNGDQNRIRNDVSGRFQVYFVPDTFSTWQVSYDVWTNVIFTEMEISCGMCSVHFISYVSSWYRPVMVLVLRLNLFLLLEDKKGIHKQHMLQQHINFSKVR